MHRMIKLRHLHHTYRISHYPSGKVTAETLGPKVTVESGGIIMGSLGSGCTSTAYTQNYTASPLSNRRVVADGGLPDDPPSGPDPDPEGPDLPTDPEADPRGPDPRPRDEPPSVSLASLTSLDLLHRRSRNLMGWNAFQSLLKPLSLSKTRISEVWADYKRNGVIPELPEVETGPRDTGDEVSNLNSVGSLKHNFGAAPIQETQNVSLGNKTCQGKDSGAGIDIGVFDNKALSDRYMANSASSSSTKGGASLLDKGIDFNEASSHFNAEDSDQKKGALERFMGKLKRAFRKKKDSGEAKDPSGQVQCDRQVSQKQQHVLTCMVLEDARISDIDDTDAAIVRVPPAYHPCSGDVICARVDSARSADHSDTFFRSHVDVIPAAWAPDGFPSRRNSLGKAIMSLFNSSSSGIVKNHSEGDDSGQSINWALGKRRPRKGNNNKHSSHNLGAEMDPRVAKLPEFDKLAQSAVLCGGGGALRVQPRERLPHAHDRLTYFWGEAATLILNLLHQIRCEHN